MSQFYNNIISTLADKILADYDEVVVRGFQHDIYQIFTCHKIYKKRNGYLQSLSLRIKIATSTTLTVVTLTPILSSLKDKHDYYSVNESEPMSINEIYDYKNNIIYSTDDNDELHQLSYTASVYDKSWLLKGHAFLCRYLKDVIPENAFKQWLRYTLCYICGAHFIQGNVIKENEMCYMCKLINLQITEMSDVKLETCCVCMEDIELITAKTICGDIRHAIHLLCYEKLSSRQCPLCREFDDN